MPDILDMNESLREEGFTLIELLIVILILGILASIAVPFYRSSKKSALNATVQSDVHNAVPVAEANFKKLLIDDDLILSKMSLSEGNSLTLKVLGTIDNPTYCITGKNDLYSPYSFQYDSTIGLYVEGDCSVSNDNIISEETKPSSPEIVAPPKEENVNPPVEENVAPPIEYIPENPNIIEGEYQLNDTYTKNGVTYKPNYSFNNFNTGSSVTIRIDITTDSKELVDWEYVADLNKAPYFNPRANDLKYTGGHIQSIDNSNFKIKAMNKWNGVKKGSPVSLTYNFINYQAPNYNNYYKVEVTKATDTPYYTCLNLQIKSTSEIPIAWSHDIDLNQWFASIDGKQPQGEQVKLEHLRNNFYRVTGNKSNNDYVSNKHSLDNHRICYNPLGGQSFK